MIIYKWIVFLGRVKVVKDRLKIVRYLYSRRLYSNWKKIFKEYVRIVFRVYDVLSEKLIKMINIYGEKVNYIYSGIMN